jgi:hypothetical protein
MDDVQALSTIIEVLKGLDLEAQKRVLRSVRAFLEIEASDSRSGKPLESSLLDVKPDFSRDRTLSPKEFLRDKSPSTDVSGGVDPRYFGGATRF